MMLWLVCLCFVLLLLLLQLADMDLPLMNVLQFHTQSKHLKDT